MTVFKERLYQLMNAAGYSIESLSLETGINQSSLRSYLAGRSDIPVKKLIAIADTLDCSIDYLLGRTDGIDMATWAENYTSTECRIIEKKLPGDSVSDLTLPAEQNRMKNAMQKWTPIAVWPYNLIETVGLMKNYNTQADEATLIRFYNDIKIPITEDQEKGLVEAVNSLSDRERDVILKHYRDCLTLDELAEEYSISRERVRQIEAKALRKLRHPSRWQLIRFGCEGCGVMKRKKELEDEKKELLLREADVETLRELVDNNTEELKKRAAAGNFDDATLKYINDTIEHHDTGKNADIEVMDLSFRSYNCLKRTGVSTIGELTDWIKNRGTQWTAIRNLGKKGIEEISGALKKFTGFTPDELIEKGA